MNQEGLGKYIREQRESFGGLREFARDLEMSASYLSDIELGKRSVSKAMVLRLCIGLRRAGGGDIHRSYDRMLKLSGHLSRERIWLLSFAERAPERIRQALATSLYAALYEELDVAFANSILRQ